MALKGFVWKISAMANLASFSFTGPALSESLPPYEKVAGVVAGVSGNLNSVGSDTLNNQGVG